MKPRPALDDCAVLHYIALAMPLLLLLSAMLTALTGAITGARAPEVSVQQVAAVRVAQAAVVVAETAVRASAPVAAARPGFVAMHLAAAPAPYVPLYAERLRE